MTSSNVSNLLVQVSQIKVEVQSSTKQSADTTGLFDKTLKNVADSAPQSDLKAKDAVNPSTDVKTSPKNQPTESTTKIDSNQNESNQEVPEEVIDQVEETLNEVKEIIEQELDVSEEDFVRAMEELGFVMIDLLNPQNLAQLVADLTGETDSIALIMSDEFKSVLDQVNTLSNQLIKDTGFSLEQLKEIAPNVEIKDNQVEVDVEVDFKPNKPEVAVETPELITPDKPEVIADVVATKVPVVENKPLEVKPVEENLKEKIETTPVETKEQVIPEKTKDDGFDFSKESKGDDSSKLKEMPEKHPIIREDGIITPETKFEIQFNPENEQVVLPTGETVKANEIVNQLIEQARILNTAEATTMEMTLNPEGLGKIYMEITQKGDEITAKIFTENDAVKFALETQMANLRVELNNNSTKVTSIEVSVGTHEFERNLDENGKDQNSEFNQGQQSSKRQSRIDINSLDDMSSLMSDEDMLIAQMMLENGNSLDFQA